jgi:hypothetical protein
MMNRAYTVYLLMFGALIGGMALIWARGDNVRAPDDLSGDWIIEWDNAPPPESGEPKMHIAQSGRYFVVTFGQRPAMSMKLQDGWTGKGKGRTLDMRLASGPWELRLDGDIPPRQRWQVPEMNLELVGPTRHVGIARRVLPARAENAPDPDPAPAPTSVPAPAPAETGETAQASPNSPATQPTPAASVPAETAHAR